MINKISLLTPCTSLLICSSAEVIINEQDLFEQDLLCLSITDIIQLPEEQKQTKLDSLKKLYEDITRNLEEVLQELKKLELPDVDLIFIAEPELINLTSELQENEDPNKVEELQNKIFFLYYYIYLWYKKDYILNTQYFLHNGDINMGSLLASQAAYIRVIDIFKNYFYKYPNVIKAPTPNFQKEQEKIHKMYDAILATNNNNVEYIENVCKHNTQQCLSLTTSKIEKLNKDKQTKDQLNWISILIYNYNMRYVRNKIDKLLNILVPLNVITLKVQYDTYELQKILKELEQNNRQYPIHHNKEYILAYCRYLCQKYEYVRSLVQYIFHVQHPDPKQRLIDQYKEESEAKLKQYNEVKKKFTKQLQEYLKLIKANPQNKELQQCKPKKEEIEDIWTTMSESNKTLLIQLLETNEQLTTEEEKELQSELTKLQIEKPEDLEEETKTGIILPGILVTVGTLVIGGIGYVFYRIKTHKKEKDKEQTKEKTNIASK